MTTVTPLRPRTTPDSPSDPDITALAAVFTDAGFTPERLLAQRDTEYSRAVADEMRRQAEAPS